MIRTKNSWKFEYLFKRIASNPLCEYMLMNGVASTWISSSTNTHTNYIISFFTFHFTFVPSICLIQVPVFPPSMRRFHWAHSVFAYCLFIQVSKHSMYCIFFFVECKSMWVCVFLKSRYSNRYWFAGWWKKTPLQCNNNNRNTNKRNGYEYEYELREQEEK